MRPRLKFLKAKSCRPLLQGLVACLMGLGSPSCGSWSGNPPSSKIQTGTTPASEKKGTVEIVVQGTGTSLRLVNTRLPVIDKGGKAGGLITLTSALLVLSHIEVRREPGDLTPEARLSGPFTVDLLTNTITPQPEKLTLPEGSYKDMVLQFHKQAGGSVLLTGTYTAANDKTSGFRMTLDADDSISLAKNAQVIQVTPGSQQQIAITFQMDQWFNFSGKDADLTHINGQDTTIDSTATGDNRKLREAFLVNVKAASGFDKLTPPSDNKEDKSTKDQTDQDDDDRARR